MTVTWIRSGVTLATDDTPQLVNERYLSSYNIQKLNSSTSGEYNCSFVASGTTPFIRGSTASNTTNITLDIKSKLYFIVHNVCYMLLLIFSRFYFCAVFN